MPAQALVIEFAGLPGSGKSTVAKLLASHINDLDANRITFFSNTGLRGDWRQVFRKLLLSPQHLLIKPRNALHYCQIFWRTRPGIPRIARLLVSTQRIAIEGRKAAVVILDQGAAQLVWSVLFSAVVHPSDSDLRAYLETVHKEHNNAARWIVILHCRENVLKARLIAREIGKKNRRAVDSVITSKASDAFRHMRAVVASVAAKENIRVLELNGEQSPERLCDTILLEILPAIGRTQATSSGA